MTTIWKFPLPFVGMDRFNLEMPSHAKILTVQVQKDTVCIWAMVNPDNPPETRKFAAIGTGHPIDVSVRADGYVGTYQLLDGNLVFHVFEVKP